jgi:hypothetical protein
VESPQAGAAGGGGSSGMEATRTGGTGPRESRARDTRGRFVSHFVGDHEDDGVCC